jgi:hypothetical protein
MISCVLCIELGNYGLFPDVLGPFEAAYFSCVPNLICELCMTEGIHESVRYAPKFGVTKVRHKFRNLAELVALCDVEGHRFKCRFTHACVKRS